jgi:5-methylcytosine-specific restriction endonuclease McrA
VATATRDKVRELLEEGKSLGEISRALGISKPTACYHKRKLGYAMNDRHRYDWAKIQRYYDEGHSVAQCVAQFGFTRGAWFMAVQRGAVIPRPRAMALEKLLVAARRDRHNVKRRLVAAGIKRHACEHCGISRWGERALSLCLHHINGDRHDNRLENLELLCPNCHSQTPNFGSKNKRALAA